MTQHALAIDRREQEQIDPADRARLDEMIAFIRDHDDKKALAAILPNLSTADRAVMSRYCRFSHAALLVFPRQLAAALLDLRASGLDIGKIIPSVVVRERLCLRYGVHPEALDVGIVHAPVDGADGRQREIEIFLLTVAPGTGQDEIAAGERVHSHETHIAFEVSAPDTVILSGLRATLTGPGQMRCDGGGYNAYEDATVLYFRPASPSSRMLGRVELIVKGHHPEIVRTHRSESTPPQATSRSAKQLLQLMTGAWTTQAIAAAAELSLADHLADSGGATGERLAELADTDPDSLSRLLRYLTSLGILRSAQGRVQLTELGHLLRTDTDCSLHPLAQLYGGLFYESFGQLTHTVRTGRQAFEHVFGANHFDYIAERPELARLFDRAMAASAAMFTPVADFVDFSAARVVVDVAGGDGELLGKVLGAVPHLRGVLLERSHVIEAAREKLGRLGCAERCEFVAGDFTRTIPGGGDVYILSRVLHDWDDEQCLSILRRCADAMAEGTELLVLERLLPEGDSPSLATAWDVHMMCNVGGRERTLSHYRRLLQESGFQLHAQCQLPLDAALLRARRRTPRS